MTTGRETCLSFRAQQRHDCRLGAEGLPNIERRLIIIVLLIIFIMRYVLHSFDSLTVPHSNDCVGRLRDSLTQTLVKHTSKFHLANRTIMQLLLELRNKIFAPNAKRATLSRNSLK